MAASTLRSLIRSGSIIVAVIYSLFGYPECGLSEPVAALLARRETHKFNVGPFTIMFVYYCLSHTLTFVIEYPLNVH